MVSGGAGRNAELRFERWLIVRSYPAAVLFLSVFPDRGRVPRVRHVQVDHDWIVLELQGGLQLRLPTAWSPPLVSASVAERERWYLVAGGTAVRWPQAGELVALRSVEARRPTGQQGTETSGAGRHDVHFVNYRGNRRAERDH